MAAKKAGGRSDRLGWPRFGSNVIESVPQPAIRTLNVVVSWGADRDGMQYELDDSALIDTPSATRPEHAQMAAKKAGGRSARLGWPRFGFNVIESAGD